MTPWWVRNAVVIGHFIPLTSGTGIALATASRADGRDAPSAAAMKLDEVARSAELGALARKRIAADPKGYLEQVAARTARTMALNDHPAQFFNSFSPPPTKSLGSMAAVSLQASYASLLVLAAIVLFRHRRDPMWELVAPWLAATAAQLLFFAIWFEFGDRHRSFFLVLVILVAGRLSGRASSGEAQEAEPAMPAGHQ